MLQTGQQSTVVSQSTQSFYTNTGLPSMKEQSRTQVAPDMSSIRGYKTLRNFTSAPPQSFTTLAEQSEDKHLYSRSKQTIVPAGMLYRT